MAICLKTTYWWTLRLFKFLLLLIGSTVGFVHENTRSLSTKAPNPQEYKSKATNSNQLWTKWSSSGDNLNYLLAMALSKLPSNRHPCFHSSSCISCCPFLETTCGWDAIVFSDMWYTMQRYHTSFLFRAHWRARYVCLLSRWRLTALRGFRLRSRLGFRLFRHANWTFRLTCGNFMFPCWTFDCWHLEEAMVKEVWKIWLAMGWDYRFSWVRFNNWIMFQQDLTISLCILWLHKVCL